MSEATQRRRSPRRRTTITGHIRTGAGNVFPCVVRDVSKEGARISVAQKHVVTGCVDLALEGSERSVRMRVAWRQGEFCGLTISGASDPVTGDAID